MNPDTIWVCVDCLLAREGDGTESPDREPWGLLKGEQITLGMMQSEHTNDSEDCLTSECDCVFRAFDTSDCEACGSRLAGERHAYTLWTEGPPESVLIANGVEPDPYGYAEQVDPLDLM